ncbi:MAG: ATP-grasp domain-containing protein, partial [Actinomycetota bacterium]|nr:ATP-grasp domain-containing protein [Actinomycetota bacterium]
MPRRTHEPGPDLDRSVPVLIVKIGRYPLHHGGVAAIRSLGRLGVPTYAVVEDRFTPAAVSRYLTGRFVWPTSGEEDPDRLVAGLVEIGRRIGRPFVALPTDDEAAVLLAEHAGDLGPHFLLSDVTPALPRALADKHGLAGICRAHGVAAPASALPSSVDELVAGAEEIGYPVVVKNAGSWG